MHTLSSLPPSLSNGMPYYDKMAPSKSYYDLPMAIPTKPFSTSYCQPAGSLPSSTMPMSYLPPGPQGHIPSPTMAMAPGAGPGPGPVVDNKYRQLPCRTFISVGTCPYRERCIYLHDPRIICREAKTKTRRKNKEDNTSDSLFWPIMPLHSGMKLDSNRQPAVIQQYVVPAPTTTHDEVVYSIWMHFVDFCIACSDGDTACYQAPDGAVNMYTGKTRLPIFRTLSACTMAMASSKEWDSDSDSSVPLPLPLPYSSMPIKKDVCRSPDTVAAASSPPTEYRYLY